MIYYETQWLIPSVTDNGKNIEAEILLYIIYIFICVIKSGFTSYFTFPWLE